MSCTAQRGSPYGMESYTAGYPIPLGPVDSDGLQRRRHPLQLRGRVGGDRQAPALVTHRCIARCKAPPVRGMQLSGAATFGLREHAALRCNLACWRRSGPSRNFATAVAQAPRRQFPECVSSRCCADRPQRLAASPDGRRLPRGRSWLRKRQVGSPLTDLHRDWALPSRSCPGTGLT